MSTSTSSHSDFLRVASGIPHARMYALALTAGIILAVIFLDDFLRLLKFIIYRSGLFARPGQNAIPGPIENTRFTRFMHGKELTVEYRKRYGPLYRLFSGSTPEVVLTDPEDVRVYYQGDAKIHLKKPNIGMGHYLGRVLGQCVGLKHNEDWRRLRSHVDGHFTASLALESLPVMLSDVTEWLDVLPQLPVAQKAASDPKRFTVEAESLVSELPFKMIARRLFGDLLDDRLLAELYSFNDVHTRIMIRAFFGKLEQWTLASYLPTQANRDIDGFEQMWTDLLVRISKDAVQKGVPCTVSDMYQKVEEGGMNLLEFTHTVDEILFSNIDITTTSIAWAVTLIAQHADIQARIVEEMSVALKDESAGSTADERIAKYLCKTNTLMHYSTMEVARVRPLSFYTLPEVTAEPKVIRGYSIPAGTSVLIDAWTLNRKSAVWGADGEEFRPDRFTQLSPMQYRYAFWRFGIGPRKCMGHHFGDKIIKSCLFQILMRYNLSVDGGVGSGGNSFVHSPAAKLVFTPRT